MLTRLGRDYRTQATGGINALSRMELARSNREDALKSAEDAQRKEMAGTGAGMGYMVATSGGVAAGAGEGATMGAWAGPVGMVVGAAAGLLLSQLF